MKIDSLDLTNFPITNTYFIIFLALGTVIGLVFVLFGCFYHSRNETDAEYRERRENEDCVQTSCCCCLIITELCCLCHK